MNNNSYRNNGENLWGTLLGERQPTIASLQKQQPMVIHPLRRPHLLQPPEDWGPVRFLSIQRTKDGVTTSAVFRREHDWSGRKLRLVSIESGHPLRIALKSSQPIAVGVRYVLDRTLTTAHLTRPQRILIRYMRRYIALQRAKLNKCQAGSVAALRR